MSMWSLTYEKVEKLKLEEKTKNEELDILLKKPILDFVYFFTEQEINYI